jgi:hypothetical protein
MDGWMDENVPLHRVRLEEDQYLGVSQTQNLVRTRVQIAVIVIIITTIY